MFLAPIGSATIQSARDIMLLRNLINPRLFNAKFLFNLGCGVEVGDTLLASWQMFFVRRSIIKQSLDVSFLIIVFLFS